MNVLVLFELYLHFQSKGIHDGPLVRHDFYRHCWPSLFEIVQSLCKILLPAIRSNYYFSFTAQQGKRPYLRLRRVWKVGYRREKGCISVCLTIDKS